MYHGSVSYRSHDLVKVEAARFFVIIGGGEDGGIVYCDWVSRVEDKLARVETTHCSPSPKVNVYDAAMVLQRLHLADKLAAALVVPVPVPVYS